MRMEMIQLTQSALGQTVFAWFESLGYRIEKLLNVIPRK
jgi:hypothetical protein